MKIQPEELVENGFEIADRMDHKNLIPFVQLYIRKRTISFLFYYSVNLFLVCWIILQFYLMSSSSGISIGHGFNLASNGILFAFLIIPLHEGIHALAYKSLGAVKTSFDVNWMKFYFLAIADRFVASRREFPIVAIAPFAFISLILLVLYFVTTGDWQITWLFTLFTHTACCSGDFALLSYFDFHSDKEMVTYDDRLTGESWFYKKPF